jgi:hypothetical protein
MGAREEGTWSRVTETRIRASGISLGASGVGLGASGATVRASWYGEAAGRKKGDLRRRAELRGEHRVLKLEGRLLNTIYNIGRAAAGAVESAPAAVHVERV